MRNDQNKNLCCLIVEFNYVLHIIYVLRLTSIIIFICDSFIFYLYLHVMFLHLHYLECFHSTSDFIPNEILNFHQNMSSY